MGFFTPTPYFDLCFEFVMSTIFEKSSKYSLAKNVKIKLNGFFGRGRKRLAHAYTNKFDPLKCSARICTTTKIVFRRLNAFLRSAVSPKSSRRMKFLISNIPNFARTFSR